VTKELETSLFFFFAASSTYVRFRNTDAGTDYLVRARGSFHSIDCNRIHRNICANMEVSLTVLQG